MIDMGFDVGGGILWYYVLVWCEGGLEKDICIF